MADNETPNEEGNSDEAPDFGRVLDAIGGLSDTVMALSETVGDIDGRIQALESAEPPPEAELEEAEDPPPNVELSAVLDRLDQIDQRMDEVGQSRRRSGEDLINLARSRRFGRRGVSVGDFRRDPNRDYNEDFRLAVQDGDIDRAKGIFWNRLDAERGFH